ncbi:SRPBCC family protein [Ornithinibacillus bavariensis]|uniref:ATPase n=1 Tax=Ornithinibacillus bavariensis TaxID=545502 RepID=A0A920C6J1_9BACI|nr:SRPBCC family protein [Ornithinibacillus bavariensis]GIO26653.1 ATPase [Ornithinibacillus bavariensis]
MTTFTYVSYIHTSAEELWKALTSSAYTEKYFFGSAIESEWKVGAEVKYLREGETVDYGNIITYEPYHQLTYTWTSIMDKNKDRQEPTKVTFLLKQMGQVVKLTLKHENLLPEDIVEEEDTFQGFNNGWPAIISNLKTLLETGDVLEPVHV